MDKEIKGLMEQEMESRKVWQKRKSDLLSLIRSEGWVSFDEDTVWVHPEWVNEWGGDDWSHIPDECIWQL